MSDRPPIKALLFDMDGLLVDSEPLWYEVERSFVKDRCGGDWTHEQGDACVGGGIPATLARIGEIFRIEIDIARDERDLIDRFIARIGDLELKPGAREILAASRGSLRLALASSSPVRLIEAVIARFSLGETFDVVVSGEHVPRMKPAPDIFLRAAADLGVEPASCVVLEDSIKGATAGWAAGMIVIAIPEGSPTGRGFETVADAILTDLSAARAWLGLSNKAELAY